MVACREVDFDTAAIPPASEWERTGQALSGAPAAGETMDDCGAVVLRQRPQDGEIIALAEINGIKVTRNAS